MAKIGGCGCLAVIILLVVMGAIGSALPKPAQQAAAPTLTAAPVAATATRAPTAPPTAVPAVTGACQYVRGFAAFVTLIGPNVAGDCRENEHPSPTTPGNIEQATANGLLVWNNTKRLSMFTNGSTSWYGCGTGARSAPSSQAFDCSQPQPSVALAGPDAGDIQAYLAFVMPEIELASQGLDSLNAQNRLVENSPRLLLDSNWKAKTAVALALMDSAGTDMQKYEPVPQRLKVLDDLVVTIGKDLKYIVAEYMVGVDGLDAGRINNATARLSTMNQRISRATAEIKTLTGQ